MHSLSTYLPRFLTRTLPSPELMDELARATKELQKRTPTEARVSELTQFYRRQVRSYWDEDNLSIESKQTDEEVEKAVENSFNASAHHIRKIQDLEPQVNDAL